ncbi:hypothetical protein BST81_19595 [Leptolyngbya sp. 'hensonii']|nr:hypothetical protein BST81_19595 [Leptolyngbya sp. 'hensonii']
MPSAQQVEQFQKDGAQRYLAIYEQMLESARQRGSQAEVMGILTQAALSFQTLGNHRRALELAQQALDIARAQKNQQAEAGILAVMSISATALGLDDGTGTGFARQQLQQVQSQSDRLSQVPVLLQLMDQYRNTYDVLKAIETATTLTSLAQDLNNPALEMKALEIEAWAYSRMGNYPQAIQTLKQQLALFKKTGIVPGLPAPVPSSIPGFDRAAKFADQAARHRYLRQILSGIAEATYLQQGTPQPAITLYEQQYTMLDNDAARAYTLNDLAYLYAAAGDAQKPAQLLEQALKVLQSTQDEYLSNLVKSYGVANLVLQELSRAYALKGDYTRAIEVQRQVLQSYPPNQSLWLGNRFAGLANLGILLLRTQQFSAAKTTFTEAIETFKQYSAERVAPGQTACLFGGFNQDTCKLSQAQQLDDLYRNLQLVLVELNQPEQALEVAETSRAVAIVELLNQKLQGTSQVLPVQALNLAQIQQVARTQKATLVQYSVFYREGRSAGLNSLASMHLGTTTPQATDLLIWVIQPTGQIAFRRVNLSTLKTPLSQLVQVTRDSIGVRGRGFTYQEDVALASSIGTQAATNQQLRQLHQVLIQPIAELLPDNPEAPVIFIPQDELFLVPFAALQDTRNKYLIEQHTILMAPSIQVLDLLQQPKRSGSEATDVLVVGNPTMPRLQLELGKPAQQLAALPGSEQEAQTIAKLLKTQALIGPQATEAEVKRRMPTARIIHLATHGLLDSFTEFRGATDYLSNFYQGALALAPTGQEDGLLRMSELQTLQLKAELVVLSACDTGRGNLTSDGVFGLSRSFLAAGATHLIVSLWKVPDGPTFELMTEFYQSWQRHPSKAQALRQAMLTTMKSYPDPKAWAAFTLIGPAN